MAMTDEQIERYSRHIILNEVGVKGQKKLLKGKVLIIGAGGLELRQQCILQQQELAQSVLWMRMR